MTASLLPSTVKGVASCLAIKNGLQMPPRDSAWQTTEPPKKTGGIGVRTCLNGNGAPFARIIRRMAMRGNIFPTTTLGVARIGGES